jgi:FimV-like protein
MMKGRDFWRILGICALLSLYSAGVAAEKKESLKEYLPQIDLKPGGVYGPTDKEDNVSVIAERIIPHKNTVSVDKVVKAIVLKNPDAFSAGNPKKLKVGFFLKLPTLREIQHPYDQKEPIQSKPIAAVPPAPPLPSIPQTPSQMLPDQDTQAAKSPPPEIKLHSRPLKVSPVSDLMMEGS